MLEERGIHTAHDLANAQDGWVRQRMGIVGLRTVHELRGLVCHPLDDQPAPRQTTCCSRTFGEATPLASTVLTAAHKRKKASRRRLSFFFIYQHDVGCGGRI